MTDQILKCINCKYLEQIIQDNLIGDAFDKTPYDQYLLDTQFNSALVDIIYTTYHEFNKIPTKIDNKQYIDYFYTLTKQKLESRILCKDPKYSNKDIEALSGHIETLKKIPQPEQRTPDWHIFRDNRLTASDLGTAIGTNPYSSMDKLILKKCGHEEPFTPGAAILHGVKYEDVAISIYSNRNEVNVYEFGCLPHPDIPFFGASPDGICDKKSINKNYIGRMLEIKCPTSRPITGFPPNYYFAQVQGQLAVCDLEYCDFLECKILEYKNKNDYFEDGHDLFRSNGLEKGVLIELYNLNKKKSEYIYGDLGMTKMEITIWEDKIVSSILSGNEYEYVTTCFWKLEEYLCTLIQRDRKWFSDAYILIDEFWKKVLYHRKNGVEKLIKVKKNKASTHIGKLTKKEVNKYIFLSDSD